MRQLTKGFSLHTLIWRLRQLVVLLLLLLLAKSMMLQQG
jgi:hypothetical protein